MKKITIGLLVLACTLALASLATGQVIPQLNEVVRNDSGGDTHTFVEICADPGTDLSAFTLVEIEGDGSSDTGLIDAAIGLTGIVGANGLYVVAEDAATVACADQIDVDVDMENGGITVLLVRDFTGAVGMDIDADGDCVADGPIGTIVDGVGMGRPSQGDCITYYGATGLGPDTGPTGTSDFDPAGAARCEDCTGSWGMVCLDGSEGDPVCLASNPDGLYNVAAASPCSANLCSPISVDDSSWGKIKGSYR